MDNFVMEEQIEKVVNPITKEYLKEVISCYNNNNYRASIVVLYTTIIYDLLHKLTILSDVYNDDKATKILQDIREQQKNEPKNPEWERKLIEKVYDNTELLSAIEKEQLINIKNERNYVAHPIIDYNNGKIQLKYPTKETAKDLIRKGFEIVFLKDAILGKRLIQDIIEDLNNYYDRANTNGLEIFLKNKYLKRMNQNRKDYLFRVLWKFTFVIDNNDCNKNRRANFYGLNCLYKENKEYYKSIIKNDEDYYFIKLNIEPLKIINEVNIYQQLYDYNNSRIMTLIRFIEENNDIYSIFNEHAKNIISTMIDCAIFDEDIETKKLYELTNNKNIDILFKYQLILKAQAVFLVENIEEHLKKVKKMINNYCYTSKNWFEASNYNVLGSGALEKMFKQVEYRGGERNFIEFLISYCMNASSYKQAVSMFEYMENYMMYFTKNDLYKVLFKMNSNSQYSDNDEIIRMRDFIINKFKELFNCDLIESEDEKWLYSKLYRYQLGKINGKQNGILNIIDKKMCTCDLDTLWNNILKPLIDKMNEENIIFSTNIDSYPNIVNKLTDKNDIYYNNIYFTLFESAFSN
ncbi:hypothetical protein [Clostridium butyricum]